MAARNDEIDVEASTALTTESESGLDGNVAGALSYLFGFAESVGYTIGVDWNDTLNFEMAAARIVESFAVEENRLSEQKQPRRYINENQHHS